MVHEMRRLQRMGGVQRVMMGVVGVRMGMRVRMGVRVVRAEGGPPPSRG